MTRREHGSARIPSTCGDSKNGRPSSEGLDFRGGGWIESANRIFIPVNGRRLGSDSVDVKGFAWIDSVGSIGAQIDTLTDLDALDPRARQSGGRHVRPLERSWYVYRWIGVRMRD